MKKLLKRFGLFLVPIVLALVPANIFLFRVGESYLNVNKLVFSEENYLAGFLYNESDISYIKWARVTEKPNNSVLSLGSSRVLGFREEMFDSSFYNAGYTVSKIAQFKPFLESLPACKLPKYLLLGLDQWMFNENWDNESGEHQESVRIPIHHFWPDISTFPELYLDFLSGKYSWRMMGTTGGGNRVGLNAIVNETGFRKDGSIYYGSVINKLLNNDISFERDLFDETYARIEHGNSRFQYAKDVNKGALSQLQSLVDYCKENNIHVIGFLPPFADKVYDRMLEIGNYDYLGGLPSQLKSVFVDSGFEFYNFPNVSSCNSSDAEVIDGFHGGELTYGKILIKMLELGSELNNITNLERLKKDVDNPVNRYLLYQYN
ncbi:hypothetical protein EV198_1283 [Roseivirga ehrenbergii]|uniref:Uncharacterized protein n=1 Tax=Roseivirga ehrenbergii (strain DSM 102268 / JCM 13514 / KCTC 12282 / NCIMB 14502 / KMM 6017) TaxID=279360 RepID=A0A150XEB7_ROSEK|nr:hypothetical protein [Roseivirga ehrenbergii]KYG77057.1 hypothetical protein MB14_02315 [Roseivirga ehrenbergii]TCL14440.1 hypothetical protein EV198_1283 [Roseivirga ehrenbergii]